ncbi:50S ribosomal protein L1 [Candidatus Neoehrlichia procyonis]|uniref:Ribosomal protein n=1 Tax=Candidatus Neoehrlichia procyonis str. RAC413 TaxID=1359163 RepID=A0A0F3NPG0_9RICK|nr:50S ribosomal protein L1 [Candidatus Neoehrlichia lotoris]KJV69567.1 ribosomal protein L1 [Candidatus Neoehrlichia lotoris str. RAC413]
MLVDDFYEIGEGLKKLIGCSKAKFCESVDVAIKLNVNISKADEQVRGIVVLPKGLGREIKVAVFAKGENLKIAEDAKADIFGDENLVEDVKRKKELDVDWCIATPDFMPHISPIAKILGPRGLMPNPKFGTVTSNIAKTIGVIKSGQIRLRADKGGIVHAKIGNTSFSVEDLLDNFNAVVSMVKQLKPVTVKGLYFKSVFISSTMGRSFKIVNIG